MNVRGDFLKFPHSTNTTALIYKSRKENLISFQIKCNFSVMSDINISEKYVQADQMFRTTVEAKAKIGSNKTRVGKKSLRN